MRQFLYVWFVYLKFLSVETEIGRVPCSDLPKLEYVSGEKNLTSRK